MTSRSAEFGPEEWGRVDGYGDVIRIECLSWRTRRNRYRNLPILGLRLIPQAPGVRWVVTKAGA